MLNFVMCLAAGMGVTMWRQPELFHALWKGQQRHRADGPRDQSMGNEDDGLCAAVFVLSDRHADLGMANVEKREEVIHDTH